MNFFIEIFNYFKTRKKFFLLPIIVILLILGGVLVVTQGTAVAPFIYTIF
jgi:hypothetical protein|tara:strand:- start:628 stop:777 length:150 start_codon:yes stop_codon:yes gene_type:complete